MGNGKKIILITILTITALCSVFATSTQKSNIFSFLPARDQNNNIDMSAHESFPTHADYENLQYGDLPSEYGPTHILGVVGIDKIDVNLTDAQIEDLVDSEVTITINAYSNKNTGKFVFRSADNPMYQRPFEVYLVVKKVATYSKEHHSSSEPIYESDGWYTHLIDERLGAARFSGGGETTATWKLGNLLSGVEKRIDDGNGGYTTQTVSTITGVYADIVLGLPAPDSKDTNQYANNVIIVDDYSYYLAEADDYNTVMDITLTFKGPKGTTSNTISIPFTGYFAQDGTGQSEDSCAVSISRLPEASNLNINKDQGRWVSIANINILKNIKATNIGVFDGDKYMYVNPSEDPERGDITECTEDSVCVFVSSSKNPYSEGEEFKLVHTSVKEGESTNDKNSVGYSIRLQEDSYTWDFDGKAYITTTGNSVQIPTPSKTGGTEVNQAVSVKGYYMYYVNSYFSYYHFHQFMGDMQIMIHEPSEMMLPGAYKSTVYIHIVSQETTST